jgi:ribosomal protein S18 acetylase RimI-like enzyme
LQRFGVSEKTTPASPSPQSRFRLSLVSMAIFLRAAVPEDQAFLFTLYATTRAPEISGFGWSREQQESFVRVQYSAQRRWYETAYPQAEEQIVELDHAPIGRMIVWKAGDGAATLVDISLLPEHRGRGIGGGLIRDLLEQCRKANVLLRLQVLRTNPAARLYQRLGFHKVGEDDLYFQMQASASS